MVKRQCEHWKAQLQKLVKKKEIDDEGRDIATQAEREIAEVELQRQA